jgi:hypothetical protein
MGTTSEEQYASRTDGDGLECTTVADGGWASEAWDVCDVDGLNWSFRYFFEKAYGICPTRAKHHKNIVLRIMV